MNTERMEVIHCDHSVRTAPLTLLYRHTDAADGNIPTSLIPTAASPLTRVLDRLLNKYPAGRGKEILPEHEASLTEFTALLGKGFPGYGPNLDWG